jgi:hypothetical protein
MTIGRVITLPTSPPHTEMSVARITARERETT